MSLHRRDPRRDANEAAIVAALERIGIRVWRISSEGLPDLLTFDARARAGGHAWLPLEVKGSTGRLTPAQQATREQAWFPIVTSVAEALHVFGVFL